MKPIRRELLIHTISYAPPISDSWGDPESVTPVTVKRVRVEPTNQLVRDGAGEQIIANTVLFWDRIVSTPCNFEINGKVAFNGREMTIVNIADYYDRANLHHKEITLK